MARTEHTHMCHCTRWVVSPYNYIKTNFPFLIKYFIMKVSFPNAASIIVRKEQTVRGAATQQHAGAGRGKIKEQSLIDFDSLEVKMNSLLEKAEQEPDGFEILNAAEARAVATAAAINEGASAALPSLLTSSEYVRGMVSNFSSPFRSGRLLQSIGGPLATTSNTSNIAVRSFDGGVVPLLPKDVEGTSTPFLVGMCSVYRSLLLGLLLSARACLCKREKKHFFARGGGE